MRRLPLYVELVAVALVGAAIAVCAAGVARLAGGSDRPILLAPLASFEAWPAIVLPVAALLIEWRVLGWHRCSIRRLVLASPSTRSDLAWWVFNLSGGVAVLANVAACGAFAWLEGLEQTYRGLLPLNELPAWQAFPVFYVFMSFVGYWEHRAMHTRLLWPLHQAHHSAREFTIVNALRGHPIEVALSTLINVVPPLLIGFSPEQSAVFVSVIIVLGAFLHCNWNEIAWLERYGISTPAGHRLHHAVAARFHDRNFGEMTNLWDKLFGTYCAPGQHVETTEIGVDAAAGRHDTTNPLLEIFLQTVDWLLVIRSELAWPAQKAFECVFNRSRM